MTSHRLLPLSGGANDKKPEDRKLGSLERADVVEEEISAAKVVAYHERTKHHFHRYAAALGYMDWATQPDPFRRYVGVDLVRLPLPYWQRYANINVANDALGCNSLATLHSPRALCSPRRQLSTWSLHACPRSGQSRTYQTCDACRILLAIRARLPARISLVSPPGRGLVNAVFSIESCEWQGFYHFTVGDLVEYNRLTTLPAYNFEEQQQ